MKYKTVTLADLTLEEMKFIIKEYRKLLGRGVYGMWSALMFVTNIPKPYN